MPKLTGTGDLKTEQLELRHAGKFTQMGAVWRRADDGTLTTTFKFESDESQWSLEGVLELRKSDIVVTQLTITAKPTRRRTSRASVPGFGVTSTALRDLGPQLQEFLAVARSFVQWCAWPPNTDERQWRTEILPAFTRKAGGGLTDSDYLVVARHYLRLQAQGLRNGLMDRLREVLSEEFGRDCTLGSVRRWVTKAEDHKYLEPAQRGVAGRLPGPRFPKEL